MLKFLIRTGTGKFGEIIFRLLQIYKVDPNKRLQTPKLPLDFFDLSPEELKKEQQLRESEAKKLTSLRTQEMRNKDVLR